MEMSFINIKIAVKLSMTKFILQSIYQLVELDLQTLVYSQA